MDKSTLYVVSTPIGNMEDITLRAIRVLKEVDLIAAEDTRITRKILSRYDIHTSITSYFEGNRDLPPFYNPVNNTHKKNGQGHIRYYYSKE